MGYASEVYRILDSFPIPPGDSDQRYYTKIYLNETLRQKFDIKLDHRSQLFQNLNRALDDIDIRFEGLNEHAAVPINTIIS